MLELKRAGLLRLAALGLALQTSALVAHAETAAPVRLQATAVNLSGVGRVGPEQIEIVIERWSTDAERDKLLGLLREKGDDALLHALQSVKPRAGYIRTSTSLGWDIQFARERTAPDGTRRIVFATDRPMGFYERTNAPRSSEYEFMVCEVHLGKDGVGDGKLSTLAKISYDPQKKEVEIEDYGLQPVRLTRVAVEK